MVASRRVAAPHRLARAIGAEEFEVWRRNPTLIPKLEAEAGSGG